MISKHLEITQLSELKAAATNHPPLWVRWFSSEGRLLFGVPILGWMLILPFAFLLSPDNRSFKFACSFIWCGFDFVAVVMLFVTTIFSSCAKETLKQDLSMQKPFLYFYLLSSGLVKTQRRVVILLGCCKVLTLSAIGFALWGGFLILGMWLFSPTHA